MKELPKAMNDSQRAMNAANSRPAAAAVSECKNPTSQQAKAMGMARTTPRPKAKGK